MTDPSGERRTLEELRALSEAATPGPWRAGPVYERESSDVVLWWEVWQDNGGDYSHGGYGEMLPKNEADARLIPAAVNYVRSLLAARSRADGEACICGLDDSPNGARLDIVCPKHDPPPRTFPHPRLGVTDLREGIDSIDEIPLRSRADGEETG